MSKKIDRKADKIRLLRLSHSKKGLWHFFLTRKRQLQFINIHWSKGPARPKIWHDQRSGKIKGPDRSKVRQESRSSKKDQRSGKTQGPARPKVRQDPRSGKTKGPARPKIRQDQRSDKSNGLLRQHLSLSKKIVLKPL